MRGRLRERLEELLHAAHWDEAFELLHAELAEPLKRFIRGSWQAASVDDISQVVWLAVGNGLSAFRFDSEPETWVFGIAKRKIVDARRKRHESVASDPDAPEMRWSDRLSDSGSPFSRLLYTERAKLIRQIIADWDERDRLLFEMRFFADLDPAEIAETFDPPRPRNTVTQRLLTLVGRLREKLAAITSIPPP
jgi:RNA polymerase sigma factor (sigma-70 family)